MKAIKEEGRKAECGPDYEELEMLPKFPGCCHRHGSGANMLLSLYCLALSDKHCQTSTVRLALSDWALCGRSLLHHM